MAKTAKASAKGKPAQKTHKKPAKVVKATTAKAAASKAKPAAKPGKPAVDKSKAGKAEPKAAKAKAAPAPAKVAAAAPAKAEKTKAPKEKKAASPSPTIMSGAPIEEAAAPVPKPKKEPKPKVDKAEARKARRAAKDLLAGLEKLADARAKWEALFLKASDLIAEPYKMSGVYEPRTAIMHKILGWGYVLNAQNDRLEVLFKDGVKMLISNYKPA